MGTEPEAAETGMIALTPEALGDALSCRSQGAAEAFASALFLTGKPRARRGQGREGH